MDSAVVDGLIRFGATFAASTLLNLWAFVGVRSKVRERALRDTVRALQLKKSKSGFADADNVTTWKMFRAEEARTLGSGVGQASIVNVDKLEQSMVQSKAWFRKLWFSLMFMMLIGQAWPFLSPLVVAQWSLSMNLPWAFVPVENSVPIIIREALVRFFVFLGAWSGQTVIVAHVHKKKELFNRLFIPHWLYRLYRVLQGICVLLLLASTTIWYGWLSAIVMLVSIALFAFILLWLLLHENSCTKGSCCASHATRIKDRDREWILNKEAFQSMSSLHSSAASSSSGNESKEGLTDLVRGGGLGVATVGNKRKASMDSRSFPHDRLPKMMMGTVCREGEMAELADGSVFLPISPAAQRERVVRFNR